METGEAEAFILTPTDVARPSGATAETVRNYADRGLLEFVRLKNGTRLFKPSAIRIVRSLRAKGLANRGRKQPG